jgi:hypothetical protein
MSQGDSIRDSTSSTPTLYRFIRLFQLLLHLAMGSQKQSQEYYKPLYLMQPLDVTHLDLKPRSAEFGRATVKSYVLRRYVFSSPREVMKPTVAHASDNACDLFRAMMDA